MLSRYVKGLPRYPMDCGWWRHPKYSGLSTEALFLHMAGVSYGNEHATDGVIPDNIPVALGVRPKVAKAAEELVAEKIWARRGTKYIILGFTEHNATAAEAEAHAAEKRHRAAVGNHKRWHEGPGGHPNPTCPLCPSTIVERSSDDSLDDSLPSRAAIPKGEDYHSHSHPHSPVVTDPTPSQPAGAGGGTVDDLLTATWAHMAKADLARAVAAGQEISNRAAWLRAVRASAAAEWGIDARRWCDARPELVSSMDAAELADLLVAGDHGRAAAERKIAETERLLADPPEPIGGRRRAPASNGKGTR